MRFCIALFCALLETTAALGGGPAANPGTAAAVDAARAVLAATPDRQQQRLRFDLTDAAATEWTYFPWGHVGLPQGEMSRAQRDALDRLLGTALSEAGLQTVKAVIDLEQLLYGQSRWMKWLRDPGAYHLAIFGQPDTGAFWLWRYGGHHLSLNIAEQGQRRSATPLFIGANPAQVTSGPMRGLRVLGVEEDSARGLFNSLDAAQRQRALIDTDAPRDILTGRDSKVSLRCCEGLPAADMTASQRRALLAIVHHALGRLSAAVQAAHLAEIEAAGVDTLHFAWAGDARPGFGHYFRIHSAAVLIEYDNTQNKANHAHFVVRHPTRDFGGDALAEHIHNHH